MKIYIDAGHGGSDPGAVADGRKEKDLNLKVALYLGEYLKTYGCSLKYTRVADTEKSIMNSCKEANAWKADLFISIHFNAGKGTGFENYYYSAAGKKLCTYIETEVKKIPQVSRGVKERKTLGVLKYTNMVACLNEGAFMDTPKDIAKFNTDAKLKKLAVAYGKGIVKYLGLTKTPIEEVNTSTDIIILETKISRLKQELSTNESVISDLKDKVSEYEKLKIFTAPKKAKYTINLAKGEKIYYMK